MDVYGEKEYGSGVGVEGSKKPPVIYVTADVYNGRECVFSSGEVVYCKKDTCDELYTEANS